MTTKKKTLLELMMETSIKWPEGAEYAAQDFNREQYWYADQPTIGDSCWHGNTDVMAGSSTLPLASDWNTHSVSRSEYEAAVADKVDEQPKQPATIELQPCGSATPTTIEQRIASLRALDKQVEETRAELTSDLHAMGITWLDGAICDAKSAQPVITDWRDLQVGDVIWWAGDSSHDCGEYTVKGIESEDYDGYCPIHLACGEWVDAEEEEWRFIRRPQH